MGRQLIGYRIRAVHEDSFVYVSQFDGSETFLFRWSRVVTDALTYSSKIAAKKAFVFHTRETKKDMRGNSIDVTDATIVAVYLKTNEHESSFASKRERENLSTFDNLVLDEIDRRKIDAIVEPENFGCMPTTLRFRAARGDFVWLPIFRYAVVDGPKHTRAQRTVDRMLEAIAEVSSKRVHEKLSEFSRDVLDEIDRRGIDAFFEPEEFDRMSTTLRFCATNGDFVWLPIVRHVVVGGPEETRAARTVDRMLEAIADISFRLGKEVRDAKEGDDAVTHRRIGTNPSHV